MSADFTPTTEDVRARYGWLAEHEGEADRRWAFDRWLAEHDKELVVSFLVGGMGFQRLVEMVDGDHVVTLKGGLVEAVRPL